MDRGACDEIEALKVPITLWPAVLCTDLRVFSPQLIRDREWGREIALLKIGLPTR
jgi:hypothetical protein